MNIKSEADEKIIETFQEVIRHISALKLATQLQQENSITTESADPCQAMLGYWMSAIFVSGSNIKLILKTHFDTSVARTILSTKLGHEINSLQTPRAFDFIRELSNMTAGGIKQTLDDKKIPMGISIPLVTRGFDEIMSYHSSITDDSFRDVWTLKHENFEIHYSIDIYMVDINVIRTVGIDSIQQSDGEFEFL